MAAEVALAVVGDEESANGPVAIIGAEVAFSAVEARNNAAGLHGFEDGASHRGIAKSLRQKEILGLGDGAELAAMLLKMLVELLAGVESGSGGEQRQRGQKQHKRRY